MLILYQCSLFLTNHQLTYHNIKLYENDCCNTPQTDCYICYDSCQSGNLIAKLQFSNEIASDDNVFNKKKIQSKSKWQNPVIFPQLWLTCALEQNLHLQNNVVSWIVSIIPIILFNSKGYISDNFNILCSTTSDRGYFNH